MPRFHTLTQRFGALYASVLAILLGICALVILHLQTIRVDSSRLLEEAREQSRTTRMLSVIDSLGALLAQSTAIDPSELARARQNLEDARRELASLDREDEDPSRPEHQRDEERIVEELEADLATVENLLAGPIDLESRRLASSALQRAEHYAEVLLSEASGEATEAHADLESRARLTRTALLLAGPLAVLLLTLALAQIQRHVVRPLGELREGTERFGDGDRSVRLQVHGPDEIGRLAASINQMADQLSAAQRDLEQRVQKRTRQFIRAARLADLGVLASGIAHELNTPLASIASSAEGLQRRAQAGVLDPNALGEYTQTIVNETMRAREITTRMLGLVRQEPSEIASIPMELAVRQAVSAMQHRAERRGVRLESVVSPEHAPIRVNAGELVQVLVNLIANAIDASAPGGVIQVEARLFGGRLRLRVADQGSGIPEEQLERIWDPFFSTKAPGEGTGLGLALVATMVETRLGRISVHSVPGEGTEFTVDLPTDWEARG